MVERNVKGDKKRQFIKNRKAGGGGESWREKGVIYIYLATCYRAATPGTLGPQQASNYTFLGLIISRGVFKVGTGSAHLGVESSP
jgi:hypothetical protein